MSTPIDFMLDAVQWEPVEAVNKGDGSLPWVTHRGVLSIGEISLRCYVLSDGQRILDADDVRKFFSI